MNSIFAVVDEIGRLVLFSFQLNKNIRKNGIRWSEVMVQLDRVILQSLWTVAISGFFVGAILVIQFTLQIQEFGALGFLGGLVTSATVREVGPLLIAFMLSGKIGAFTTAELGTMKITDQLDAIKCLGADPLEEIIIPRFIAIELASVFLLGVGVMTSVLGGVVTATYFSGISLDEYIRNIAGLVTFSSLIGGLFKCVVFSFTLAWICTFMGCQAEGGTKGVGDAVVATAVYTMIGIVTTDWLTTQIYDSILDFTSRLG